MVVVGGGLSGTTTAAAGTGRSTVVLLKLQAPNKAQINATANTGFILLLPGNWTEGKTAGRYQPFPSARLLSRY
jgi:hypothetical protein